jgi:thiol-disulfide isomerase/thioredoxin
MNPDMKTSIFFRFLILLLMGWHAIHVQAQQVVYYENFQGRDFPANITLINLDQQIPLPEPMGKSQDAWIKGFHPGDPSRFFATTSSRFGNGIQADRWMILPSFVVPENGVLRWEARSSAINPQNWEDYQVLISTTGRDPGKDFTVLFEERATYSDRDQEVFTPWSQKEMDLGDYAGKEVSIAFRAMGTDGFLLFIDEISVSGLASLSFSLHKVSALKYHKPGEVKIKGSLLNSGRELIHSFDAKLKDARGNTLATTSFSGLSVRSNQTFDFDFPDIPLTEAGIHRLQCVVSNPNGGGQVAERDKDNKELELVIISESAPRQVLTEFYTGTWCGHCPKGVLTMKRVLASEEDAIPAFIHHRDVFAIPEADSLIMFMPNGYPSATFDRFNMTGSFRPAVNSYTDDSWQQAIIARKVAPSPVTVNLLHSFDPATRLLNIQLAARFVAETFGDFRVNVMLTEDNLKSSVYDQLNYANADPSWPELNNLGNPIPDYRHDYVVRRILDGPWGNPGKIPHIPPLDEELIFTYEIEIPEDWKANDVYIIAYISEHQEAVHETEVLNATRTKMTDADTAEEVSKLEAFYAESTGGDVVPAPDFSIEDIHGNMVSLSDFKGKVVYIDFWATWCAPCRAEIPHLNRLKEDLKANKDIVVIGISTDAMKDKDKWKQVVKELNMGDVQLFAGENAREIMDAYIVRSIPHFTIINKDGTIFKNMTVRPSNSLTKQILLDLAK